MEKRELLRGASRTRRWLRQELSFSEFHGILFWAGLIGFGGALVIAAFHEGVQFFEYLLTGQAGSFVEVSMNLSPLGRVAVPTVGALLAGLTLQFGMSLAKGRRSTDYMEAIKVGDGYISTRASLVRSTSSLFTIGSGGSIGREGAMVQLAAMIGAVVGRLLSFPRTHRRLLVACGAAAGIASAYNAPLAAALFVCEILLQSISLESMGPIIVASVIANATLHQLLGYGPVYEIPLLHPPATWELIFYLLLGLVAGQLAPAFLWLLDTSHGLFQKLSAPVWVRLTLGGVLLGLISVVNPEVWGNGFTVVNSILHHPWTWQALMSVLICKVLATASMVGSGAVGGVFTPTLFCGAVLGALVGTGVHALWPETATPSTAYAVVGMGAFLAATTHAPLMSIVMVFELTRQYEIVLPMMLASIAAHYMARSFGRGKSIYSDSLEGKPNQKPKGRPFQLLDLLRDPDRAVPGRTSADGVRRLFADTSYNRLQCVDEQSIWLGSISRAVADKAPAGSTAAALVEPDHRALTTGMSLEQALLVACDISSEILPVVDEAGKYLGNISKSDLLRVLQRQLHQKA